MSGLTARIECSAHLCATEGTVSEESAVFACERYALCHTLVDDAVADLCQTIDVGLAGTLVTTLNSVIEQTVDAVTVVRIVLCCVDTTLSGY